MPDATGTSTGSGTFLAFPPRMKAASFTIDQVQERLEAAISVGH